MNRPLTPKEKRTIRFAALGVAIYLAVLYGSVATTYFTARRAACDKLIQQAANLRDVIKPYEEKIATATNLMARFHMDPAKLKRTSVVAEASAAVQQAAVAESLEVGAIRETPGRASAKEAGSIQLETSGPIPAVLAFLHHLDHVGFPVIIDSLQFGPDPRGIKVNVTMVVLDFDAWKPREEKPHV